MTDAYSCGPDDTELREIWDTEAMEGSVPDFLTGAVNRDVDAMMGTLAPDARLESPVMGRMVIRGTGDLRVLLEAVFGTGRGLTWEPLIGDGSVRVAVGQMKIGPFKLKDATVFDLDEEGRISRMRPHLGPLGPLIVFAMVLGPKIVIHPGVLWRAVRR